MQEVTQSQSKPLMLYSKIPVREIGNGVLSSVLFLMAYYVAQFSFPECILVGAATWLGYRLQFGTDLTLAEIYANVRGLQPEMVDQILSTATSALARIKAANIPDRSMAQLLADISEKGDEIVTELREKPQKLLEAHRFVTIYLDGAAKVSEKFANVYAKSDDKDQCSEQFRTFLTQTKDTFNKQQQALIADDKIDLDLDIRVLQQRMSMDTK